jgi:membrane-associated phospholipid phosphatase
MIHQRPWKRALAWLLFLGPFFFLSYGFANWLASQRVNVPVAAFEWERAIPFQAWTIVPYWSIDALYALSLFICATRAELDAHARRLLTAQLLAIACFIAFPFRFSFQRPAADGIAGMMFDALAGFDLPYNQLPSLHIALAVILWVLYAGKLRASESLERSAPGSQTASRSDRAGPTRDIHATRIGSTKSPAMARILLTLWFVMIGASVLTTFQHHFIDLPTGFALGWLCVWLWPMPSAVPGPVSAWRYTDDPARHRMALVYFTAAFCCAAIALLAGGVALWLCWPALSLALVGAFYAGVGAAGFQKDANGRLSLAARWLLAPYLAGAWLNSRWWTRRAPQPAHIADDVWIGRMPGARDDLAAFAGIVDVSAELSLPVSAPAARVVPMLDLVTPEPATLGRAVRAIEASRERGPVLVCCALGFSRSAGAVAAWLLSTGRVPDAAQAIGRVRDARREIVLHDGHARLLR